MILTPHLIDWIKAQLAAKGWDLAELSRHTHTSAPGWSRILSGQSASLRARAIGDLCRVFEVNEIELYHAANPDAAVDGGRLRENHSVYGVRDKLVVFIERDLSTHPAHRSAYEAIATAFGYRKES